VHVTHPRATAGPVQGRRLPGPAVPGGPPAGEAPLPAGHRRLRRGPAAPCGRAPLAGGPPGPSRRDHRTFSARGPRWPRSGAPVTRGAAPR